MTAHEHPHGITGPENAERIWVCEECNHAFGDETVRRPDFWKSGVHQCTDYRWCESHLDPYVIDTTAVKEDTAMSQPRKPALDADSNHVSVYTHGEAMRDLAHIHEPWKPSQDEAYDRLAAYIERLEAGATR